MNNESNFNLTGKLILITGASSGLGKASAIACANAGADLILVGRNFETLAITKSEIGNNVSVTLVQADLSKLDDVEGLSKHLNLNGNRIGGFVHAAGESITLPIKSCSSKKFHEIYQVNVVSGLLLAGQLANRQVASPEGASFVFLSSIMGFVGEPGKTIYASSKGALLGAVKSLALELAPRKIRVNAISPGVIETPMVLNSVYRKDSESYEALRSAYPLGFGQPSDVANVVLFLISKASRWITGTNIVVDGGYTAK